MKHHHHITEFYTQISTETITKILQHDITRGHSKSHGHGGQNVNKRHTTAEGYLHIDDCSLLNKEQKSRLHETYHNHISHEGVLRLTYQKERSLHQNRKELEKHFGKLLELLGKESVFDYYHHKKH